MFNEEALKELAQDPRINRIAPIFQRALQDEHYRNGLLIAARKMVSPEYAEYLQLAFNRAGLMQGLNAGLNSPALNTEQQKQGGLFNV